MQKISSNMEWRIWIAWCIIFYIRYLRLFWIYFKHGEKTINPSITIFVHKIENRIKFKTKIGFYLKLLTMKLLESTQSKKTKSKNDENVPKLEITEVILVHCNIVNNNYQQNSRVFYTYILNKSFGQLLDISHRNFIFLKTFDSNFHILKCGILIKILNC